MNDLKPKFKDIVIFSTLKSIKNSFRKKIQWKKKKKKWRGKNVTIGTFLPIVLEGSC